MDGMDERAGPTTVTCPRCGLEQVVEVWSTPRRKQCEDCPHVLSVPSALQLARGESPADAGRGLVRLGWLALALLLTTATALYLRERVHPAAWPALAVGMGLSLALFVLAAAPPRRMGLTHLWLGVLAAGLLGVVWLRVERAPERLAEQVRRSERQRLGELGGERQPFDAIAFDALLARAGHASARARLLTVVRERRPGYARAAEALAASWDPWRRAQFVDSATARSMPGSVPADAWMKRMEWIERIDHLERDCVAAAEDYAERALRDHRGTPGDDPGLGLAARLERALADERASTRKTVLDALKVTPLAGWCRRFPDEARGLTAALERASTDDASPAVRAAAAEALEALGR